MDIYILRHAIAEERSAAMPGGDSQRRLTDEGAKKMRRAARGMKTAKLSFDLILTSPYVRARQMYEMRWRMFLPFVPPRCHLSCSIVMGAYLAT